MTRSPSAPPASASPGVSFLEAGAAAADQRLDNFLLRHLKGVPKSLIYRKIRKGEVRVNGKRARPETRLSPGDSVRIPPLRRPETAPAPVPGAGLRQVLAAAVLFEDEHLLVLNKPSGLAVHAGSGSRLGVIEALRAMHPDGDALELVHRLDKGTSGCLVISRSAEARKAMLAAFQSREVAKEYHLLVCGRWPATLQTVDLPLQRGPEQGGERRVRTDAGGKSAHTAFEILQAYADLTLLRARPETGRTHQIRVHAAASGHPLLGEDKYETAASRALSRELGIKRLCLHAAGLQFDHPVSGRPVSVTAPYEAGFREILDRLGPAR